MVLYILASKSLPISVFGLLTYLEPALLTVASLLIGESINPAEVPVYLAVWTAVLIVLIGGTAQVVTSRKARRKLPPEIAEELYPVAPATGSIPIQAPHTGSIPTVQPPTASAIDQDATRKNNEASRSNSDGYDDSDDSDHDLR